ncbi:serine/threonine-protein phosphatase 6 regulatory ankyrin repeat subunit C-like [Mytilus edulis]|uniref:serine/threonine-protein phosphatase 6 regulatory ankyrin repeat subunit C-like n=1 Tax=Mytilus edulis TaxID=6550 RepID=UPI0039F14967
MATKSEFRKYNKVNTKGETPLHLAAKNEKHDGKIDIEKLLTKGVDVNARNKWGQTKKSSGIDVNSKDINGYNALQSLIAANDGESNNSDDNLPVMSICLPGDDDDDADIFKMPLRVYGHMKKTFSIDLRKSLQALINAGIDVNNQTTFGDGILHLIATREENTPLLKFFYFKFSGNKFEFD